MTEMNNAQDARIARQVANTSEDARITDLLQRLLTTEWSRNAIQGLQKKISSFFESSFQNINDPDKITNLYEALLPKLAEITKAKIADGEPFLRKVQGLKGILVVTNHFGLQKLTKIENTNRKFPVSLNEIPSSPIRFVGLPVIARRLGAQIYETALELPSPLLEIQKACHSITIPVIGKERTKILLNQVSSIDSKDKKFVIVMYPEGGTSGKRNMGGPYDLDEFQTGAFVVAAKTGLPILPVCQYFNPNKGYELYLLEPMFLSETDIPRIEKITEKTKKLMQDKLNELSQSK